MHTAKLKATQIKANFNGMSKLDLLTSLTRRPVFSLGVQTDTRSAIKYFYI